MIEFCGSGCHFTKVGDEARLRHMLMLIAPDTDNMGQGMFQLHHNLGA
jgi:hypothetical protein